MKYYFSQHNWFDLTPIDWTGIAAIAAVGVALFGYFQSESAQKESKKREAIEKLLTPLRKELDDFSKTKWDNWEFRNRWNRLKDKKLDFPLQYYWLQQANSKLVKSVENFDQKFERFDNLRGPTQMPRVIEGSIVNSVRKFVAEKSISIEGNAGNLPANSEIINSHWACSIGGKSTGGAVTLYSLVMWKASLSDYLESRKQDKEIAAKKIDYVNYSMSDLKFFPAFDTKLSDELLFQIEKDLSELGEKKEINEYRIKWQDLYNSGSELLKEIDLWLSTQ